MVSTPGLTDHYDLFLASQASLKNQLLEAIYNDDTLMLTDALAKAEESKGDDLKRNDVSKLMLSMAKVSSSWCE